MYGLIIETNDAMPFDLGKGDVYIGFTPKSKTVIASPQMANAYALACLEKTKAKVAAVALVANPYVEKEARVIDRWYVIFDKQTLEWREIR